LAERLGWQLPKVEALERAEDVGITLAHLDQLATALEVHPVDLFRRDMH
jgi:DNA-binding Xre family transcriptional regulator